MVAPPGYEVLRLEFRYPPRRDGGETSVHPQGSTAEQDSVTADQAEQDNVMVDQANHLVADQHEAVADQDEEITAAAELLSSIQPMIEESSLCRPTGQITVPLYDGVEEGIFSDDDFISSECVIIPMTVIRTIITNNPDEAPEAGELPSSTVDPKLQVPNTEGPPQVRKFDVQSPFLRGRLRKKVREFAKATSSGIPIESTSQAPTEVIEELPDSISPAAPVVAENPSQVNSPTTQPANT